MAEQGRVRLNTLDQPRFIDYSKRPVPTENLAITYLEDQNHNHPDLPELRIGRQRSQVTSWEVHGFPKDTGRVEFQQKPDGVTTMIYPLSGDAVLCTREPGQQPHESKTEPQRQLAYKGTAHMLHGRYDYAQLNEAQFGLKPNKEGIVQLEVVLADGTTAMVDPVVVTSDQQYGTITQRRNVKDKPPYFMVVEMTKKQKQKMAA